MLAHDIVHDRRQRQLLDDVIIFHIGAAGIEQRLFHETLHMIDLLADRCARFAGVVVCDQLGCGQRRLDLMHPHLDVVFVFVFRDAVALDVFLHRSAGLVDDLI